MHFKIDKEWKKYCEKIISMNAKKPFDNKL